MCTTVSAFRFMAAINDDTEGVEGIDFHPVALNRVYKSAVIK